jgi:hypothetical protein
MMDFIIKYKWWILISVVLIITIVVVKRRGGIKAITSTLTGKTPKWKTVDSTASVTSTPVSSISSKCSTQSLFPLKKGSSGKQVGALQRYINAVPDSGVEKITVDCDFGPKTEAAVLKGIFVKEVTSTAYNQYQVNKFE